MSDLPPAGWNTDPDDPTQYRYWDGRNWTDHRAPKSDDTPSTTPTSDGRPAWKSPWIIGAAVLVLIIVFASMGEDGEGEPETAAAVPTEAATALEEKATASPTPLEEVEPSEVLTETPPPDQSVSDVPVLAMSPDEFATRWDQMAAEFDMNQLATGGVSVESGSAQDIFQEQFSDNLVLMGTVLHSGELRDVLLMAQASEQSEENLQVMSAWGVMVATLSPDLTNDERGNVLKDLGLFTDDDSWTQDGYEAEVVRGDVRYSLRYSEMIGWMFSGAPADS